MTTTEVPLGIDEAKPSSRVLRPPGGGSSFSLGGDPAPPPQKPRQSSSEASPAAQTPPTQTKSPAATPDNTQAEGKAQPFKPADNSHSRIFGDSGQPSPTRGRDLSKGASNPITGAQNTPSPTTQDQPKKVRQPPGGFSHGIF